LNALSASELAVVPVTCDYFSVQSFRSYLKLLTMVQKNTNPELDYKLLVTMFESRTRLSHIILEQFRQKYAQKLLTTIIPLDVKLRESPVFGRPITQYASRARGAQEYRLLARELLQCRKATI
jgi:chromosome partitioning protein